MLNNTQTAKKLGISRTTLHRMKKRGEFNLPVTDIGRSKKYGEKAIEKFIKSKTI